MEWSIFKQNVRKLIGAGKLTAALSILDKISGQHILRDEILMISRQLKDLNNKRRTGVISDVDADVEKNKIHQSLVSLLEELSPDALDDHALKQLDALQPEAFSKALKDDEPFQHSAKKNRQMVTYLSIAGIALVLLLIFVVKPGIILIGNNNRVESSDNQAERDYEQAFNQIGRELDENFISLITLTQGIERYPPEPFTQISPRRVNEKSLEYNDRGLSHHRTTYLDEIWKMQEAFAPSSQAYDALFRDLNYDSDILTYLSRSYERQEDVQKIVQQFVRNMRPLISNDAQEPAIYEHLRQQHETMIWELKIALLESLHYYLYTLRELPEVHSFHQYLRDIYRDSDADKLNDLRGDVAKMIAELYQHKKGSIERSLPVPLSSEKRQIDRRLNDPYLIEIRKIAGLPDTLNRAEIWSLENKQPLTELSTISDLLTQAHWSFIESDGSMSKYYLEKILRTKKDSLDQVSISYLQWSVKRLVEPDIFDGAIGLMVFEIDANRTPSTDFQSGDIIIKLNGEIIDDPEKLSLLTTGSKAKKYRFLIFRNNTPKYVEVLVNGPLGIRLSQLIMYQAKWY